MSEVWQVVGFRVHLLKALRVPILCGSVGLGFRFRVEPRILGECFFGCLVRLKHMVKNIEGFKILT